MAKKKATSAGGKETGSDGLEGGFDANLVKLEALVGALEGGELGLEEAMERFAEGVKLLTGCRDALASYENRVKELSMEAEEGLGFLDPEEDED